MASDFNLNQFLNEYKTYNDRQHTSVENGKAAMEKRTEENIVKAVQGNFLGLTLKEKLSELGVGDKVVEQLGESAKSALFDVIKPITEYYNKYEKVLDPEMYQEEVTLLGKTMFFAEQQLSEDAERNVKGKNFVLDM